MRQHNLLITKINKTRQCTVHRLHNPISGICHDPHQNERVCWHSQGDKSGERAGLRLPLQIAPYWNEALGEMFFQKRHPPDMTFKTMWKKIQRCSNVIKKVKRYIYIYYFLKSASYVAAPCIINTNKSHF